MRIAVPKKVSEMKVTSTTDTTIDRLRRNPWATSPRINPSLMSDPCPRGLSAS
jgi:hypothetical protein